MSILMYAYINDVDILTLDESKTSIVRAFDGHLGTCLTNNTAEDPETIKRSFLSP